MKNKIFLIFLMCLFVPRVLALSNEYSKTFKTDNYGFYVTNNFKCGNEEVTYFGYTSDGKLYFQDADEKMYVWDDKDGCKIASNQDILNAYNEIQDYSLQDGNVLTVGAVLSEYASTGGHILNTEPYNPDMTYWQTEGNDIWEEANELNENNIFDDDYYISHKFFHLNSVVYDSSKIYYKKSDTVEGAFEKLIGSFTEDEALDIYIIDDDYDGFKEEYTDYTYNETYYNDFIELYGNGSVSLSIIDNKIIANVIYGEGEEYHVKHYDMNNNEIYTKFDDYYVHHQVSNFIVLLSADMTKIKILDADYNPITIFDYPDSGYPMAYAMGDSILLNVLDFNDWGNEYFYFKSYYTLEGKNQTYTDGKLTFKFNGDLELLDKLFVDGKEVNSSNYTASSGSTVIELNESFLRTLENGEHTIKVLYKNGVEIGTIFNKKSEINPKTGDNIIISIILAIISFISLVGCGLYINKKKKI